MTYGIFVAGAHGLDVCDDEGKGGTGGDVGELVTMGTEIVNVTSGATSE